VQTTRILSATTSEEQRSIRHTIVLLGTALSSLTECKRKLAIERCFVYECLSDPATLALDVLAGVEEIRNV
jgi:hypothetical protein